MSGDSSGVAARRHHGGRSSARLTAVQALYQVEIGDGDADAVVAEFLEHRLKEGAEDASRPKADPGLFCDLVLGAWGRRGEIDARIGPALSSGWTVERLELLMRAVLRAGTFELLACPDVPARVVIDEYIEVARAFFGRGEPSMVNGVLDRIARETRAGEFGS